MADQQKKRWSVFRMPERAAPAGPASRAFLTRTMMFRTLQAQKVMARAFDSLARSLFQTSVILRIICSEDEIARVDAYIDEQFEGFMDAMKTETEKYRGMLEMAGIEEHASFTAPRDFEVKIDNPRSMTFLRLIHDLDTLIGAIETCWISALIKDEQRKTETYRWQKQLFRISARIITLEATARNAAVVRGKTDEVQQAAPAEDRSMVGSEILSEARTADTPTDLLKKAS